MCPTKLARQLSFPTSFLSIAMRGLAAGSVQTLWKNCGQIDGAPPTVVPGGRGVAICDWIQAGLGQRDNAEIAAVWRVNIVLTNLHRRGATERSPASRRAARHEDPRGTALLEALTSCAKELRQGAIVSRDWTGQPCASVRSLRNSLPYIWRLLQALIRARRAPRPTV